MQAVLGSQLKCSYLPLPSSQKLIKTIFKNTCICKALYRTTKHKIMKKPEAMLCQHESQEEMLIPIQVGWNHVPKMQK